MAFNGPSGYPASHRQLQRLQELVVAAGHTDLRDARGPLGLTQRQAGGRFTRDEADELIALLEAETEGREPPGTLDEMARVRTLPDDVLASELQRRGWVVLQP